MSTINRAELAAFLRARRDRLQPAEVGLTAGRRRRTPGLRRQEVAQLAGISIDYYIRLEQGRGPHPSRQVLAAIARTLRLTDDETGYLFRLAGEAVDPPSSPQRTVRPGVLHLLDRLDDTPAVVCDATYDLLAWNSMAVALLGDLTALAADERNIVWRFFCDPAARQRHDPDTAADFARASVADLRAAAARYPRDPRVRHLIDRLLTSSDEFAELWNRRDVDVRRSATKRIHHPMVGWLDLDCEALHDPQRDQWIVFYTAPPGTPARQSLQLLQVLGSQEFEATDPDPRRASDQGMPG